jgi:hypothetical protein
MSTMMQKHKEKIMLFCLLISLLGITPTVYAVSELTIRVTDLVSIISTRANVKAIDEQGKKSFLKALSNVEQELRTDEAKAQTNPFNDTPHSKMYLLLKITRTVLENDKISFNQREMLIQQIGLIIKESKDFDFSGEDNIRSYHLFAKSISVEETFLLLSENAQAKLPLNSFTGWWQNTVKSVTVKKIDYLGQNQYKVWLLYVLKNGNKQCSEDWLQLIKGESGWLIDDFYWGQASVAFCENLSS